MRRLRYLTILAVPPLMIIALLLAVFDSIRFKGNHHD